MPKSIGMIEFTSIARGIFTADKMVKASEVEIITSSTSCPGKYIVIISGDVGSVQTSIRAGEEEAGEYLVDSIIIPNVTQSIFPAILGATMPEKLGAVGIIESFSIATMIIAADAALKSAEITPIELRLGNGIGGKAYFTFTGVVSAVQTAVDAGIDIAKAKGLLVNYEVIPSPAPELLNSLL